MRPSPPGRGCRLANDRRPTAAWPRARCRRPCGCLRARRRSGPAPPARAGRRGRRCPSARRAAPTTWAPKRSPRSRASRIASSACGPPRTGTSIERPASTPRCLTTAMSHGDSRTTASMVGEKTGALACCPASASARAAAAGRRRAAPAEDDEVGALLPDRLDHAIGGAPADADHGPDLDALLVAEVQHALQQAARGAGLRGALGQRDALGHLHDAQRGDLGRPPVADPRADAHQVARRARVGERQQDPIRRAAAGRHQPGRFPAARISFQRVTRYGLSSSNSRAWASMTRSAWSVVISSVSPMKPAVRAEVQRRQRGEQLLAVRAGAVEGNHGVVQAADPQLGGEVEVGRRLGDLHGHDPLELLRRQHLAPHLALRQPGSVEVINQLGVVPESIALVYAPGSPAVLEDVLRWLRQTTSRWHEVHSADELLQCRCEVAPALRYSTRATSPMRRRRVRSSEKRFLYRHCPGCDHCPHWRGFGHRRASRGRRRGIDRGVDARAQRTVGRNAATLGSGYVGAPLDAPAWATSIEAEIGRRMESEALFATCYADLDHFEGKFNDRYGYYEGDRVIRVVAKILHDVVKGLCGEAGFVGHIGGDDFLDSRALADVGKSVPRSFRSLTSSLHFSIPSRIGARDTFLERIGVGNSIRVPLMTLSIGVVTNERRLFTHPSQVSALATEMKKLRQNARGISVLSRSSTGARRRNEYITRWETGVSATCGEGETSK